MSGLDMGTYHKYNGFTDPNDVFHYGLKKIVNSAESGNDIVVHAGLPVKYDGTSPSWENSIKKAVYYMNKMKSYDNVKVESYESDTFKVNIKCGESGLEFQNAHSAARAMKPIYNHLSK